MAFCLQYQVKMLSSLTSKPFQRRTLNKNIKISSTPKPQKNESYSLSKSPRVFNARLSQRQLSKLIPNTIIYDKETLYQEVRQLKIVLNRLIDENTKLKTKIAYSLYQQQKINKNLEFQCEDQNYSDRFGHRGKSPQKDGNNSMMIILQMEQLKKQHEKLFKELSTIKKNFRYTKINQLELHIKVLLQENNSLFKKNEQYKKQIERFELKMQDYQILKGILHQRQIQNRAYIQKIEDLYIQLMKLESTNNDRNHQEKQQWSSTKKEKHREKISKPQISTSTCEGINKKGRGKSYRSHHIHVQPIKTLRRQQLFSTRLAQKEDLLPFFTQPGEKTSKDKNKIKVNSKEIIDHQSSQKIIAEQTHEIKENIESLQASVQQNNIERTIKKITKQTQQQLLQEKKSQEEENNQVSEKQSIKSQQSIPQDIVVEEIRAEKDHKGSEIDKIFQCIERSESTHRIHSEPNQKFNIQFHQVQQSKKDNLENISKTNPLKKKIRAPKLLKDIKTLLTYRFSFQKYSFQALNADLSNSKAQMFTCNDLCYMMVNQPFYLNVEYSLDIIKFILEKEIPQSQDCIDKKQLILKLKEVIGKIKVLTFEEQSDMTVQCVDLLKVHESQLKFMFKQAQNEENTVTHSKMIEILLKCQFSLSSIQFLIAQISIYSEDLQHLNYQVLFQRFLNLSHQKQLSKDAIEEKQQELQKSSSNRGSLNKEDSKKKEQEADFIQPAQKNPQD